MLLALIAQCSFIYADRYRWTSGDEYVGEYVRDVKEGSGKYTFHTGG